MTNKILESKILKELQKREITKLEELKNVFKSNTEEEILNAINILRNNNLVIKVNKYLGEDMKFSINYTEFNKMKIEESRYSYKTLIKTTIITVLITTVINQFVNLLILNISK